MFVCKPCLPKVCNLEFDAFGHPKSYGRCESCLKNATCADCPPSHKIDTSEEVDNGA